MERAAVRLLVRDLLKTDFDERLGSDVLAGLLWRARERRDEDDVDVWNCMSQPLFHRPTDVVDMHAKCALVAKQRVQSVAVPLNGDTSMDAPQLDGLFC